MVRLCVCAGRGGGRIYGEIMCVCWEGGGGRIYGEIIYVCWGGGGSIYGEIVCLRGGGGGRIYGEIMCWEGGGEVASVVRLGGWWRSMVGLCGWGEIYSEIVWVVEGDPW